MVTLETLKQDLPGICKPHRIANIDAYGSIDRNQQTEESDIDLLVEFMEPRTQSISKRFFGLLHDLEDNYQMKIDLLTEKSLQNPYLIESISRDRTRVYGE
jgi:predicted nucleotidyltransferase